LRSTDRAMTYSLLPIVHCKACIILHNNKRNDVKRSKNNCFVLTLLPFANSNKSAFALKTKGILWMNVYCWYAKENNATLKKECYKQHLVKVNDDELVWMKIKLYLLLQGICPWWGSFVCGCQYITEIGKQVLQSKSLAGRPTVGRSCGVLCIQ
jgi:hypothetical protein